LGRLGESVPPNKFFTDTKMKNFELSNKKSTSVPSSTTIGRKSAK
jgi:hypothetical protein